MELAILLQNQAAIGVMKEHCRIQPLVLAVRYKNVAVAGCLLTRSAGVEAKSVEGHTLLELAVFSASEDMILLLVRYGLDINMTNSDAVTILMHAFFLLQYEIVPLSIRLGADVNKQHHYWGGLH